MTETLTFTPERTSYVATDTDETIGAAVEGGLGRRRRDISGSSTMVDVTWLLPSQEYELLVDFYMYATTSRLNLQFLIGLIVDQPELTTHLAYFVPSSFALAGVQGDTYTINARLEVTPLVPDAVYDNSFVDAYGAYTGDTAATLARLAQFANVDVLVL